MVTDPRLTPRERRSRPGSRIGIVVARFHEELTGAMLASALRELEQCGVKRNDVRVAWVPGSFELPIVAQRMTRDTDVEAILCFGLVLKGETEHDHWVASGAVQGLMRASLDTDVPMQLGVLTCATIEQARERALPPDRGGKHDKGREAARAAIDTLLALDEISGDAA